MQDSGPRNSSQFENLVLFTQQFPYDDGEVFLRTEIQFLSRKFGKILIIPSCRGQRLNELPPNVSIRFLPDITDFNAAQKLRVLLRHPLDFLHLLFFDLIHDSEKARARKKLRQNLSVILFLLLLCESMESVFSDFHPDRTLFYSYWGNDRATLLSLLKQRGKVRKAICRVHGFDLYRDQNPYVRFRRFQLKWMDHFIAISRHGLTFLRENFPEYTERFRCFRLGVKDQGSSPFDPDARPLIVSCSTVEEHKQVLQKAEAIGRVGVPLHWIHFGGGILMDEMKAVASRFPDHITWEFPGSVPNAQILSTYGSRCVHAFVSFSRSEGIPFSMMEAISFGIPIVGPDVGGVHEIVTRDTGILLPKKAEEAHLTHAITEVLRPPYCTESYRKGVKSFWDENFNSARNFESFIGFLDQL